LFAESPVIEAVLAASPPLSVVEVGEDISDFKLTEVVQVPVVGAT